MAGYISKIKVKFDLLSIYTKVDPFLKDERFEPTHESFMPIVQCFCSDDSSWW